MLKDREKKTPSESPNVLMLDTPKTSVDIFKESLKLEDCLKISLSSLRNSEKEVKDIHKLALFYNNSNQIKGEKQLADLSELIKFMSDKFDEFEKDGHEQKKVNEELRDEISSLNENLTVLLNRWIGKSNILDEFAF